MTVILTVDCPKHANVVEEYYTNKYDSITNGYNKLKGAPGPNKSFWKVKRSQHPPNKI